MAQGGGKPGYPFKAAIIAEPHEGRVICIVKEPDEDLWEYIAEGPTDEFVVQLLRITGEHHPGGDNQQEDS